MTEALERLSSFAVESILVMKFDSLEQMLDMIENADRWIQIEYSMTENYISENKRGGKE